MPTAGARMASELRRLSLSDGAIAVALHRELGLDDQQVAQVLRSLDAVEGATVAVAAADAARAGVAWAAGERAAPVRFGRRATDRPGAA